MPKPRPMPPMIIGPGLRWSDVLIASFVGGGFIVLLAALDACLP